MIVEKIDEMVAKRIKLWPVRSNRASEAGHQCERYLVYLRLNGEERAPHSLGLQYIFDEGKRHEKAAKMDLEEAGFEVIEAQRGFEDKDLQLTGKIDFEIPLNGKKYPIEVKSMAGHIWDKIRTIEDMTGSDKPYMQRYPAQITLYLYLSEKEEGFLLLRNKQTGRYKEIAVKLDWALADGLVEKLQRVNECVAKKQYPKGNFDPNHCKGCAFAHICLPDIIEKEFEVVDDAEFEKALNRRDELKPYSDEYKKLDEGAKKLLKGVEKRIVGAWMITGKPRITHHKAQEAKEVEGWSTKIVRLDEVKQGN